MLLLGDGYLAVWGKRKKKEFNVFFYIKMKPVFKILMLLFTNSSVLQHQNAAALTSTSLKEEGKDEEEEGEE